MAAIPHVKCDVGSGRENPAAFYDVHGKADKKRTRSPGQMYRCPRAGTQAWQHEETNG